MKFDVLTIFPEQVEDFLQYSILKIAQEKKKVEYVVHDLRDWAKDKHRTVDDRPYGGGPGMVMKIEPVYYALQELKKESSIVIALTAKGELLDQRIVEELSADKDAHYILLAGHYEGFDQRILDNLVDRQISIGRYVLSGGELPVLVLIDAVTRLIPGVLGNKESTVEESYSKFEKEYPHYTRPANFKGWKVPEILRGGNHNKIAEWRSSSSNPSSS